MNLTRIFKKAAVFAFVLVLFAGMLAPAAAFAQQQGGSSGGIFGRWFGGGNSGGGGTNSGGQGGGLLDMGANFLGNFLNGLADTGHAFRSNNTFNQVFNAFDGIVDSGVNIVTDTLVYPAIDGAINVGNHWPGVTSGGEPADGSAGGSQGGFSVTVDGHTYEVSADGTVTEYDEHGNAVPSNDPSRQGEGGSGSGGASIPGASRGTVGNPFSDGTDDTDPASENDEISPFANPYLFEYDPNSTNNNPSGAGAQTN